MTRDRVLTVIARLEQVAEARRSKSGNAWQVAKIYCRKRGLTGIVDVWNYMAVPSEGFVRWPHMASFLQNPVIIVVLTAMAIALLLVGFVATKFCSKSTPCRSARCYSFRQSVAN